MNWKRNAWAAGVTAWVVGLMALTNPAVRAQVEEPPAVADPAEPPTAVEPVPAPEPPDGGFEVRSGRGREVVRFGAEVVVDADKELDQVVCLFGTVTIKGRVTGDVVGVGSKVVVLGTVEGSLVAPLGEVELGPAARVEGDLVIPMGSLKEEVGARVEGERVVIPWGIVKTHFPALDGLKEWLVKGLFLGRPLPHQFGWWWVAAMAFAVMYLVTALMFPRPISTAVEILGEQPIGSFFAGVLSAILFGPLILLLAATGIGLLVVPLVICASIVACVFGKVAVCRFLGLQIGRQTGVAFLQSPLMTLIVGMVAFCLVYMVPVVGFLVWGVVAPLGLGAVVIASFRGLRSEGGARRAPASSPPAVPVATPAAPAESPQMPSGAAAAPAPEVSHPPMTPVSADDVSLLPRAGFWIRLLATVVDFVPFIVVASGLRLHPSVGLLLWGAYHVAFWTWKGTTIGGIVFNLKLVRMDGRRVDLGTALVRALASCISGFFLCVGFFWAGWNREKQSWHDLIAGTTIVRVPKGIPLI